MVEHDCQRPATCRPMLGLLRDIAVETWLKRPLTTVAVWVRERHLLPYRLHKLMARQFGRCHSLLDPPAAKATLSRVAEQVVDDPIVARNAT